MKRKPTSEELAADKIAFANYPEKAVECIALTHSGEIDFNLAAWGRWHHIGVRLDTQGYLYRPKPEPVRRPWSKPEDVPGPVCWIRVKSDPNLEMMVISIWLVGIGFRDAGQRSLTKQYSELDGLEHSTDRINWKPCTVEEVA